MPVVVGTSAPPVLPPRSNRAAKSSSPLSPPPLPPKLGTGKPPPPLHHADGDTHPPCGCRPASCPLHDCQATESGRNFSPPVLHTQPSPSFRSWKHYSVSPSDQQASERKESRRRGSTSRTRRAKSPGTVTVGGETCVVIQPRPCNCLTPGCASATNAAVSGGAQESATLSKTPKSLRRKATVVSSHGACKSPGPGTSHIWTCGLDSVVPRVCDRRTLSPDVTNERRGSIPKTATAAGKGPLPPTPPPHGGCVVGQQPRPASPELTDLTVDPCTLHPHNTSLCATVVMCPANLAAKTGSLRSRLSHKLSKFFHRSSAEKKPDSTPTSPTAKEGKDPSWWHIFDMTTSVDRADKLPHRRLSSLKHSQSSHAHLATSVIEVAPEKQPKEHKRHHSVGRSDSHRVSRRSPVNWRSGCSCTDSFQCAASERHQQPTDRRRHRSRHKRSSALTPECGQAPINPEPTDVPRYTNPTSGRQHHGHSRQRSHVEPVRQRSRSRHVTVALTTAIGERAQSPSEILRCSSPRPEAGLVSVTTERLEESIDERQATFMENLTTLKKMGWYWGPLSFEEAGQVLGERPDGTFLVRDSADDAYILSLSFRARGNTYHTRIEHAAGRFSFWSQPEPHSAGTLVEFVEKVVEHSQLGRFHYFLHPSASLAQGQPPIPVALLHPLSRFQVAPSLRHSCRFAILSCLRRRDHVERLPLPPRLKTYLGQRQVYVEDLDEFVESTRHHEPLQFIPLHKPEPEISTASPPPAPPPSTASSARGHTVTSHTRTGHSRHHRRRVEEPTAWV